MNRAASLSAWFDDGFGVDTIDADVADTLLARVHAEVAQRLHAIQRQLAELRELDKI